MSVAGLRYALTVPKLNASERLLFIVLANLADREGVCFPSQKWMADKTDLSIRTVRNALNGLESKGHLMREMRTTSAGRTSDKIVLRVPCQPAKSAATPRQNVATTPYSPYGVVIEEEKEVGLPVLRLVASNGS